MDVGELRRRLRERSPERVERQRRRGKLLAWERLERLLDPGSFRELMQLARSPVAGAEWGDGVVAGYGRIGGRPVYVFAQDFTVAGGSISMMHGEKIARTIEMAVKTGVPVIGLWDSGGARIQEGVAGLHGVARMLAATVHASGVVPQVSVMLGPSAGGAAYAPALMDFVVAVEGISYMFITGPDVVKEVTGEETSFEELGGARVHASVSGVAHFLASSEEEAFETVRRLLGYLPDNYEAPLPIVETGDPPERRSDAAGSVVPEDPGRPYDVRLVVEDVFDRGSFLEVQPLWGQSIVTGFARLGGIPVCVVASQPLVASGAIDVNASVKAARFIRFCDAFGLPIIMLVDVPGYMPGVDQEHGGIIRHGAKMIYAYAEATVPKVTVVLRKAYGGAYIAMGSRGLGADIVYAWPTAEIAVLGARAAVKILHRRRLREAEDPEELARRLEEEYRREMLNPIRAAELGLVDEVIEPGETRERLYNAVRMLLPKREQRPPRRHGNIPL